jgi:putative sigma-54 modulation protein
MKVSYTGRLEELPPPQRDKLEARYAKISKLLDGRGEKEAHVILTQERHLHHAEITLNYYGQGMVGVGSGTDQITAITAAVDKLEKQALKVREKWRESRRDPNAKLAMVETSVEPAAEPDGGIHAGRQVFRVDIPNGFKPMTLDEALLAMEKDRDYVVYLDAETEGTCVLIRRRDGNFDLVEGVS